MTLRGSSKVVGCESQAVSPGSLKLHPLQRENSSVCTPVWDKESTHLPPHPHHFLQRQHAEQLQLCVVWSVQSFGGNDEDNGEDQCLVQRGGLIVVVQS